MSFWDKVMGMQNQQNALGQQGMNAAASTLDQQAMQDMANTQMRMNMLASQLGPGTLISVMGSGASGAGGQFTVHVNPDSQPLHRMTMDDLKGEAATTTLENLSNLWQARWRSQWVRRGEIDGEFYNIAATRLNAAHMLEVHQLADGTQVYRLIERT